MYYEVVRLILAQGCTLPPELWRQIWRYKVEAWRFIMAQQMLPHKAPQRLFAAVEELKELTPTSCRLCGLLWQIWRMTDLRPFQLYFTSEAEWRFHDTWVQKQDMRDIATGVQFQISYKHRTGYTGQLFKWEFARRTYYLAWNMPLRYIDVHMIARIHTHTVQIFAQNNIQSCCTVNVTYDVHTEQLWASRHFFPIEPIAIVEYAPPSSALELYGAPLAVTFGGKNILKRERLRLPCINHS